MATDTIFIYTMNRGIQGGAWSRYVFPWTPEHFTHLENKLYVRHGDIVSFIDETALNDDGVNFEGVIHWPWLDFGRPGVNKMMHAFDIVGKGTSGIQIGYDQSDFGKFTTLYAIPIDSYTGGPIGFPVNAPSFSVKLTYDGGQAWQWNSLNLYMEEGIP